MVRRTVVFFGRVQGVGFRVTVLRCAEGLAVSGWVRNEPDGTVRMVVEGAPGDVDELQRRVLEARAGNVERVEVDESVATEAFGDFGIRR